MPRVMPPSDMMFNEISNRNIKKNVATTDTGIETPMMSVDLMLRRKSIRTRIARLPPMNAVDSTSDTDWRM